MITVTPIDSMGSDLSVVNAARCSFDKESTWERSYYITNTDNDRWVGVLSERDTRLINYLAKHKHKSPFNHCFASFRVKAPIFVARQLVKHEYLIINEVSRRYVDDTPEFYEPKVWRKRATDKKQGSSSEEASLMDGWTITESLTYTDHALRLYKELLECEVAPEMARMVLPQSMMTTWIWSGSLGAFAKMASLRLKPDTQEETRVVAELISGHMSSWFPVAWSALLENPI